jgi:hypothetical protein
MGRIMRALLMSPFVSQKLTAPMGGPTGRT